MDGLANRLFLDPVLLGRYPEDVLDNAGVTEWFEQIPGRPGGHRHADRLHGGQLLHRNDRRRPGRLGLPWPTIGPSGHEDIRASTHGAPRTQMDWEIHPDGLIDVVRLVSDRAPALPVYITENGAAYPDEVTADGTVDDEERRTFFDLHLNAAREAIEQLPLRGYFAWSLLDNFEWAFGYSRRFGIVYVDYETQQRIIKRSGHWFRDRLQVGNSAASFPGICRGVGLEIGAVGTWAVVVALRSPHGDVTPRSTPAQQQVDPAAVLAFLDAVEDRPDIEMHSVMVVRHGHVVAEGWWAPYSAERPHLLYSLSKSFTSTAAAFAQAEGLLDMDDTVVSHFGEFEADITDSRSRAIRLRHVAAMASGHTREMLSEAAMRDPGEPVRGFLSIHPIVIRAQCSPTASPVHLRWPVSSSAMPACHSPSTCDRGCSTLWASGGWLAEVAPSDMSRASVGYTPVPKT